VVDCRFFPFLWFRAKEGKSNTRTNMNNQIVVFYYATPVY